MSAVWPQDVQERFNQMIAKVPVFMQDFARDKVSRKAESLVGKDGRSEITEKDMVDAFFSETPFGFHGPMKTDMQALGIDYVKYGYER